MSKIDVNLTYGERAKYAGSPQGKALFSLMEEKKSNLSVNIDVDSADRILEMADLLGDAIVVLKTHVDILRDFSLDFISELMSIANKHRFLIFEDRKFADIGKIVREQYSGGIYKVADWAHLTNAHILPGEGVIEGLKEVGRSKGRAIFLLAEMSSSGALTGGSYADKAVELAMKHKDFVLGFICQRKLTDDPGFLHFTPGCKLEGGEDHLGQRFSTPEDLIFGRGVDMITVGRGIFEKKNPKEICHKYQKAGWEAYDRRL